MGVFDGQAVSAGVTNPAFLDANADDFALMKIGFHDSDVVSGGFIDNTQKVQNKLMTATGVTENTADGTTYSAPLSTINDGDSHQTALTKLANKFHPTTGHYHTGAAGDAPVVSAPTLSNVPLKGYINQGTDITGVTGTSTDVSSILTGKSPSSGLTSVGVVIAPPQNKVIVRQATEANTDDDYLDGSGNIVYARITYLAAVWTLSYYVMISGTETAYNFTVSSDVRWYYQELFSPMVNPPVYSEFATIPSDNTTSDVVDASSTQRGLVSVGIQNLAGAKTFVDTTQSTSPITGALQTSGGLGVVKDAFIGGKINQGSFGGVAKALASGATKDIVESATTAVELGYVSGVTSAIQTQLNAKAADTTVVHLAGTESITGDKTFSGKTIFSSFVQLTETDDPTTTGAGATITPTTTIWRLTNVSLTSLAMIASPLSGETFVLINDTGVSVTVLNESGATAANRILTGTGTDLTLANNACLLLTYSPGVTRWRIVGGSGSGGGGSSAIATKVANYTVTTSDSVLLGDASAGGFTFTIPSAVGISGKEFTFKKIDTSSNILTITGSQNIDFAANFYLTKMQDSIKTISDGAQWWII